MYNLESAIIIQFYLYERIKVEMKDVTALFGDNGSGKSSLLDALQIAMFGAEDGRQMELNAQAGGKKQARTLKSYCLGVTDDGEQARHQAHSYITLIWRNQETGAPVSMGVALYAADGSDGHEVRGRYLLRGVELSAGDHIEIVNDEERPREWSTFRHDLMGHAKVAGQEVLYSSAERYLKDALLTLRGSHGTPQIDAFRQAFRFALKMRFDKSVDHIVRYDVLEARPTNVKKFKEVTESFRRLAQTVKLLEEKIAAGEAVAVIFKRAEDQAVRLATWKGLKLKAMAEVTSVKLETAMQENGQAETEFRKCEDNLNACNSKKEEAKREKDRYEGLRAAHASHAHHVAAEAGIQNEKQQGDRKRRELATHLNFIQTTLETAAKSEFLDPGHTNYLAAQAEQVKDLISRLDSTELEVLAEAMTEPLRVIDQTLSLVREAEEQASSDLKEAKTALEDAQGAALRASQGKMPLSPNVQRLETALQQAGLHPTPVCDLVEISDRTWQPVIEAYLSSNLEGLLVDVHEETQAYEVYRKLDIYRAKIVMSSRQEVGRMPIEGSVAGLITGKNPAAVAALRRHLSDIMQAETTQDAMRHKNSLTRDGMLIKHGSIERIKPVAPGDLRIGRESADHQKGADSQLKSCQDKINALQEKKGKLDSLFNRVRVHPSLDESLQRLKTDWEEWQSHLTNRLDLEQQIVASADDGYAELRNKVQYWEEQLSNKSNDALTLSSQLGNLRARQEHNQSALIQARNDHETAMQEANIAKEDMDYSPELASRHWDSLLEDYNDPRGMVEQCGTRVQTATKSLASEVESASLRLGEFASAYQENVGSMQEGGWRTGHQLILDILDRLKRTDLQNYRAQMEEAEAVSRATFRNDVAYALYNNIKLLEENIDRLNGVLGASPEFSNGERYQFTLTKRADHEKLFDFIEKIGKHGIDGDMFGDAGELPEEFKKLLEDKIETGGVANPLDDYREFYGFDIAITRATGENGKHQVVNHLSKRIGPGSGGEHKSPLYVIAGAALASAYRLDGKNPDGIRLMLIDEAFHKMDTNNITATMRYLQQLGLQIVMAGPGENIGVLTAFMHNYYDLLRDTINNTVELTRHDVSEETRMLFREDSVIFHPELVDETVAEIRAERLAPTQSVDT